MQISAQFYETSSVRFWSILLSFEKWMEVAVYPDRGADVLVNNRCEGNAPVTVQGLVGMLRS